MSASFGRRFACAKKEPQPAAGKFAKITAPVIGTRSYDEVPHRKEA